jgi:hypothetical protein
MAKVIEGTVNFSNVTKFDEYMGQSTGKYTLTVTLSEETASELQAKGVKIKRYEDQPQRKFSSKFEVPVVDVDDQPYTKEIPYGSKVRLIYKLGPEHPVHGVSTYMERIRVVEEAVHDEDSAVAGF